MLIISDIWGGWKDISLDYDKHCGTFLFSIEGNFLWKEKKYTLLYSLILQSLSSSTISTKFLEIERFWTSFRTIFENIEEEYSAYFHMTNLTMTPWSWIQPTLNKYENWLFLGENVLFLYLSLLLIIILSQLIICLYSDINNKYNFLAKILHQYVPG